MSTQSTRDAMTRYYDAIDRRDLEALGRCVTDDVVSHYIGSQGREPWLQYFQALFEGFPDLHAEVLGMTVDDGSAAGRATFSGTHEGDFNGIPATGRRVEVHGADFVRLDADGRIAEHWAYGDSMELLQQLGVVPQPA